MKRVWSGTLLGLCLVLLLLPAAALAVTVEIAGTPLTSGAYYVNNSAKNGVEASATADYNVRYVEVGNEATLYLKGLEVNRPDNLTNLHACIFASEFTTNIPKLTIVLEGGSNTLVAKDAQSSETTDIAAIYVSNGSLVVKGTGTLTATGGIANSVASYGVYIPNGSLTIEGGSLEANGGSAANLKTSYGVYARDGIEVSGGSITGTGGNVAQISYGVYTDTITVNGTLDGTGGVVGSANDPGSSYGVYCRRNVTVTGTLTGTGGKVTLGTGNPSAASSIGVQCGGEVNVRNGSLTGTGGAAVAKTNDAISIGVATDSGINVTGNNGSVIGNGGACSKTAGTGGAFSYGVVYDGNFVVGSSSTAEASFLNGTGGVANDNSDSNNSRSIGVYGIGSTGAFTVNKGATLTGIGGVAFASSGVSTNNDCTVKGTLNGTGASYGVDVGSRNIDLSGSMTARANGENTGNASTSIGVNAGGGIHLTGQGYLLASTAAVTQNDSHNAKRPRTYDNQNALTAEDTAVWRGAASDSYQSITTYRAGYEDSSYRSRLEVKNAGNGLKATPVRWDFAARTKASALPDAKIFTVENTSGAALSSISADTLTDYTVTLPKTSLAPGESMEVTVQPNAAALNAPGNHAATLMLRGSPGNALAEIPLSFPVNNTPTVRLDPSSTNVVKGAEVTLTAYAASGTTPYQEYTWSITTAAGTTTQTTGGNVNTLKVYPTERTTYGVSVKDACGVSAASGNMRVDIETYTIAVNPALLSFGAVNMVNVGYAQPDAQTVTVTYNGNVNSITLTQPTSTDYDIGALSRTTLDSFYRTATFTVQPKANLNAGTYNTPITVATDPAQDTPVTVTPSFTVNGAFTVGISGDLDINAGESTILTANAAGGSGTYTYQWYKDAETTAFSTENPVTVSPAVTAAYKVVVNDAIEDASAQATVTVNAAPTASNVSVAGTLSASETLTGSYTYSDAEGDLEGTSTFKWYRSDDASGLHKAAIDGAAAETYALASADDGKFISFEVTPIAVTGASPGASAESGAVGPVLLTITFDSNGGSAIAPIMGITPGGKVAAPDDPARVGYIFGGWHRDAALVDKWDFAADTVNGSITLYAKWLTQLTVTGTTAADKAYDGTTDAAVTVGTVDGIAPGDDVTVTATGTFDTKEVGEGKTVAVVYALSGADAGNYLAPANDTTTADITVIGAVAAPVASPAAGTYTEAQNVTLTCATDDATIRYTIDGNEPTATSGTVYVIGTPIAVNATTTIKAKAFKTDWADSAAMTAAYTITGTVAAPVAAPVAGTYAVAQNVTLSCATDGATIRYTTDGTEPSATNGAVYVTGTPIAVNASTTIKAKAFKTDWADSAAMTAAYTITGTVAAPVAAPVAGTYTTAQSVTLSCATDGATIRYTTDNTEPTATSTEYITGAPIVISTTTTIKAKAFKDDWTDSATLTAAYTIGIPPIEIVPSTPFEQGSAPANLMLNVGTAGSEPNSAAHFGSLEISADGTHFITVPADQYDLTFGSIHIALHPDYLNALSTGTYQFRVNLADKFAGTALTVGMKINNSPSAVRITAQPEDAYVVVGQTATFRVAAEGSSLRYQWQSDQQDGRGWQTLNGGTGAAYTIDSAALINNGWQYRCVITDAHRNTSTSNTAVLHVSKAPVPPITGDSSRPEILIAVCVLALLSAAVIIGKKRKHPEKTDG